MLGRAVLVYRAAQHESGSWLRRSASGSWTAMLMHVVHGSMDEHLVFGSVGKKRMKADDAQLVLVMSVRLILSSIPRHV